MYVATTLGSTMTTDPDREALVRRVLADDGKNIRSRFSEALAESLEEFVPAMASAFQASGTFDAFAKGDEDREKVAWLIFSAVQGHLISMRLFLDGFLVQSGNAQRQVLESIAMALLCSKADLGILERFSNDTYSSNNAIRDAIKYSERLGLKKEAIAGIRDGAEFYHQFSHPSKMTIALYGSEAEPGVSYIGGIFDLAKLPQYRIEADSRVKIAKILPNFVSGVRRNLELSSVKGISR